MYRNRQELTRKGKDADESIIVTVGGGMNDRGAEIFFFSVGELMDLSKDLPKDMPVLTSGYESGYDNFYQPSIKRIKRVPENMYYDGEFQDAEKGEAEIFEAVILARVLRND